MHLYEHTWGEVTFSIDPHFLVINLPFWSRLAKAETMQEKPRQNLLPLPLLDFRPAMVLSSVKCGPGAGMRIP